MAGPIFAMIATVVVVWLVAFVFLESFDTILAGRVPLFDEVVSAAVRAATLHVCHSLVRFLPFVLPAWLFVYLARRTDMPIWGAGACGLIGLAGISCFSVLMPAKDAAYTRWVFGYGEAMGLGRILQAAVPLALAAWIIWRPSIRHRRPAAAKA